MKSFLFLGLMIVAFTVSLFAEPTYTPVTPDNTVSSIDDVMVQASESVNISVQYQLKILKADKANYQAQKASIIAEKDAAIAQLNERIGEINAKIALVKAQAEKVVLKP